MGLSLCHLRLSSPSPPSFLPHRCCCFQDNVKHGFQAAVPVLHKHSRRRPRCACGCALTSSLSPCRELLSSDAMTEYSRARVYLDEDYKSQEHFTVSALPSVEPVSALPSVR